MTARPPAGLWLILDASSGASGAGGALARIGLVDGSTAPLAVHERAGPGGAAGLAVALPELFAAAGESPMREALGRLAGVACVVGPGSFTGLRASLALAQGLHAGGAPAPVAVTVGEAFGVDLDPTLWAVTMARKGRVFVESAARDPFAVDLDDAAVSGLLTGLARPAHLAGNGAAALAALFEDRPPAVSVRHGPSLKAIRAAALRRVAGALAPRQALPLYIDAPAAKLPGRSGG